jgi:predicted cobalt transporter CbtA
MNRLARPSLKMSLLLLGLLWTTTATACSVRDLDAFIVDAVATSQKYWIASLLVGAAVVCIEAYYKRWSIILALTVVLLVFHPHLTIEPFPLPTCDFMSVQYSQDVLAVLVVMLGYQIIKILLAHRKTAQGTSD